MISAFLGLGANLGDREAALQGGRAALHRTPGVRIAASSGLYETAPVGGPAGQGDYLNAVVRVETELSPRELLEACRATENLFGRRRDEAWGPRTLDVDVLLFGDAVVRHGDLVIPHPRLHLRPFVLVPLLELAPDLQHPVTGKTIRQLHALLAADGGVRLLAAIW